MQDDLTPTAASPISPSVSYLLPDNTIVDLNWSRGTAPCPKEEHARYVRTGCTPDGSCLFHAVSKGLSSKYRKTYISTDEISEDMLHAFEKWCPIYFRATLFSPARHYPNTSSSYTIVDKVAFNQCMDDLRRMSVRSLRQDIADYIDNDERMQDVIRRRLHGRIHAQYIELISEWFQKILRDNNIEPTPQLLGEFLSGREEIIARRLEHLGEELGYSIPIGALRHQAFLNVKQDLIAELLSFNSVQPDYILLLGDYVDTDIYLVRDVDLLHDSSSLLYGGSSLHQAILGPLSGRRAIVLLSIEDRHYELIAKYDGDLHPLFTQDEPLISLLYSQIR